MLLPYTLWANPHRIHLLSSSISLGFWVDIPTTKPQTTSIWRIKDETSYIPHRKAHLKRNYQDHHYYTIKRNHSKIHWLYFLLLVIDFPDQFKTIHRKSTNKNSVCNKCFYTIINWEILIIFLINSQKLLK